MSQNPHYKVGKKPVKMRSELLFLYDVKDANPNGDPEENRPRIDEETEVNIVTDVRLKRTIRDYLKDFKQRDIWVTKEITREGTVKTREEKLEEEKIKSHDDAKKLLEKFIDLRLFGATIAAERKKGKIGKDESEEEGEKKPVKGEMVFTWTGPVQFKFGHSLHRVKEVFVKGTSVLPSKELKAAGTFTEAYILPYSLINFYGVINEKAAEDTLLSEEDIDDLLDGMWNGTKNLITRSKFSHMPRFLVRVTYKEKNFHIGDLDGKVKLLDLENKEIDRDGRDGRTLRDIRDVKVDVTELFETLMSHKDKIEKIQIKANDNVLFRFNSKDYKGNKVIEAIKNIGLNSVEEIVWLEN
ncbi:MAG: type I-B CRISPR-associated protein Cas7/Csh2 [Candidatus Bathyarchaeia archaeon]